MERKTFEFKFNEIQEIGTFQGYASVFDVIDADRDVMDPQAFTESLQERQRFPLLWQHNTNEPIGIIEPKIDQRGLFSKGKFILEVQRAREAHALAREGAVTGLSVGFEILDDEFDKKANARRIKKARLWEVSLAVFQACPGATITAVKQLDLKPYPNEHAARLRDPEDFDPDTFKRKADGTIYGRIKVPDTIDVIWGKLKSANKPSDYPVPQSLRFKAKYWTAAEAKRWLEENKIEYETFEPAEKSPEKAVEILTAIASDINLKATDKRTLMTIKHLADLIAERMTEADRKEPASGVAGSQGLEAVLENLKKQQAELRKKLL